MSTTSKVLIGLILFALPFYFYIAARTLKTHANWRSAANFLEQQIAAAETQQDQLLRGGPAGPGFPQVRHELDNLLLGRGHVWYNSQPVQIDPVSGIVTITIDSQTPHQLVPNSLIYVFGNRDAAGGYLGEFRVTAVADKQVTLTPSSKLAAAYKNRQGELERLQKNAGPWTLYDVMPADTHNVFAKLDNEQRNALSPEVATDEYKKDLQPADANDPAERVEEIKQADGTTVKIYSRQLRDYASSFHEYGRQRSIDLDRIAAEQMDKDYLTQGLERAQQTVTFRARQLETTKQELTRLTHERDAVVTHRRAVENQLAEVRNSIDKLTRDINRMATELARAQFKALNRANDSTAAAGAAP